MTARITHSKLTVLSAFLAVGMMLAGCSKQDQTQSVDTAAAVVHTGQGLGLVRAIDTAGKTITLAHNNIPDIMDAMTMDYPVATASMLNGIAVGDSVRFTLEDRGDGNYLVTNISPIKKG